MNYSTFTEPDTDQVYVSGLPDGTTEEDLAAHFGSIGMIKEDKNKGKLKIWLYRDKATGEMKGDGTVSYVDPFSAASAVEWFHNKEFKGATISVSLALTGGPQAGGRQSYPRGPSNDRAYSGLPPGEKATEFESAEPLPLPPRVRPDASQRATPIAGPPPTLQPPGPPAAQTEQFDPQPNGAAIPSYAGPGHGSAPPPPKELREGDWLCPGCGNTNFAFRGKCNRCQTAKPGSFGGGRGRGRGRGADDAGGRGGRGGRGRGVQAAPQGPQGLFSEGDWACPSCGNVNWARRQSCNTCNGPKPGTVDTNREGVGGGFKELDEAEMAEAKRRRLENEEKSMYDEFGRLKKKFRSGQDRRAREEAALARLRGDPVPGEDTQEGEAAKTDKPAAEKLDKGRDRDSDKDRGSRAYNRGHERERDRPRERERGKDQESDRRNDRDRWRRR